MAYVKMFEVIKNAAVMDASFDSQIYDIQDMGGLSIHGIWGLQSGLAGSIKVQISNDKTNWEDLPSSSFTFAGNGSKLWTIADNFYRYVKVVCTISAGNATFTINLFARN